MLASATDVITLACLTIGAVLLIALAVIDLKTRLLPNRLVLPFALLGILFHTATNFTILSPLAVASGGALCFALLYGLRAAANFMYKDDTLGLGDIKLMGAAGLWLGPELVMLALSAGAFAGLMHGIIYALYIAAKNQTKPNFKRLKIPAGPGLVVGIIIGGYLLLQDVHPF